MLAVRKNLGRAVSLAAMFVLPAIAAVPAVDAQGSDSIPTLRVNASEITIGGRVHTQFNTTTADGESPTEWLLRRVRIAAKVRINELVSGRVEPDFAGSGVSIRDAFLRLSFAPAAELTVGQAFRPFGLLAQTSSTLILPIERGARIRGVSAPEHDNLVGGLEYAGRNVGIQLRGAPSGAPLGLAYGVGVFAGPDRKEAGSAAREQFTARVTIEPLRGVRLGGGWSS
ncbi:MAG: OprO/OprP family phosphate-selective porin, partial [Gemmatimonadota bacterium]|nr:OprO/OprP family phosphate-selective porin [Gemmatimonadota bacterium]